MALLSISDAAKLVGKTAAALYRDIDQGLLRRTVRQDGDLRIDPAELRRIYGVPDGPARTDAATISAPAVAAPKKSTRANPHKVKIARLEERVRSLERIVALEAELRRVKDQVAQELRERVTERERQLQALQTRLAQIEIDRRLDAVGSLDLPAPEPSAPPAQRRWWRRLLG